MSFAQLRREAAFALTIARRRPFNVLLQVTNRCNMKCAFCDFWANGVHPRHELTLEDYTRLSDELATLGTFLISIEGGEPTLRPDLPEIVEVLSKRHLTVLYTNGWYMTPALAERLFNCGLTQVGVSIDYPDATRHDAERKLAGTFERAWRAVDLLRDAAPHGGRQVHVLTVYMEETRAGFPELLSQSRAHGVGHGITLLSRNGFRRVPGGSWPGAEVSAELLALWRANEHFRVFEEYLERLGPFLDAGEAPDCRAGAQTFNIDHQGNVSPCIEKLDQSVGNVRDTPLRELHARLISHPSVVGCQACYTLCRAMGQTLGGGGSLRAFRDLGGRMRSA